jgi:hypothetical protein
LCHPEPMWRQPRRLSRRGEDRRPRAQLHADGTAPDKPAHHQNHGAHSPPVRHPCASRCRDRSIPDRADFSTPQNNASAVRSASRNHMGRRSPDPRSTRGQPAQVFQHRLRELRPTTLRIQIFIAQDQLPAVNRRALSRNPKTAGVADVKQSGGRWRQPSAIGLGKKIDGHKALSGKPDGLREPPLPFPE